MNFLDRLITMFNENQPFPLTRVGRSRRPAPRRATTTQGYARRLIQHQPNFIKRLTKPVNGGLPRTRGMRCKHTVPAPTIDQVRNKERELGIRIHVKQGHMFNRETGERL